MTGPSEQYQGQQPPAYPPQAPYQAPPPPKKGRSKLLMGCGLVAGLLVLCGIIGGIVAAVGGGGNKSTPTVAAVSTSVGTAVGVGNAAASSAPTGTSIKSSTAPSAAPAAAGAPTATVAAAKAPATVKAYKKGEPAKLESQTVTLNEVAKKGNVVIADVTVENTGTKQANISSLISFGARDALGNQGSFNLTESKGMDGPIEPGGKLRGTLGYEFAADATGTKLYYTSAAFTGQPTVFALDDAAATQTFPPHPIVADAKPLDTKVTYKVGDTVKVGDLVMKLEKVNVQGTFITADFVGYNAGGKAANLSSLLSFTGQDSTGKKGDFKLADKAGFDGTLLPGDSLRGQVRLEFDAGSTGHTLTYRSSVFGGQAVKWGLD